MGAYGSPEYIPAPEPHYKVHYCKHCQCDVSGDYCSLCGRALSKRSKWKLFWTIIVSGILGAIAFFIIIGVVYSFKH